MTSEPTHDKYMSDCQNDIGDYGGYLKDFGYSDSYVSQQTYHIGECIRSILSVQGDIRVLDLDAESRRIIENRWPRCSAETVRNTKSQFARFIMWETGYCPDGILGIEVMSPRNCGPRFIQSNYSDELERFRTILDKSGFTPTNYQSRIKGTEVCLSILAEDLGITDAASIDLEAMIYLNTNLSRIQEIKQRTADGYVRALGTFVEAQGLRNPQKDYTAYRRAEEYTQRVMDLPYGDDILEFAEWMRSHNYREASVRNRLSSLVAFVPRIAPIIGSKPLEEVTMDDFFLIRSKVTDLSEYSMKQYMSAFARLIYFATGRKVYDGCVMLWNEWEAKRTFITQEQWKIILLNADPTQRIVIMLGSLLGLRRFEMAGLKLEDFSCGVVTIHGKGHGPQGKVVRKEILPTLQEEIDIYMKYRQNIIDTYGDKSEGHLIVNDGHYKGIPVTNSVLSDKIRSLSKAVDIDFSTHTFRRFYASSLYRAKVDLDVIRRMMRHNSLDTTLTCYINSDPALMQKAGSALEQTLFG